MNRTPVTQETLARLRILLLLGLRSLAAHRVKSAVVGSMLTFGTFLTVSGSALFDSILAATAKSVTSSLAGDLQVYSAEAEDPLALFGGVGLGTSDIGELPEIERIEAAIGALPEVRTVVPMGITTVTVFGDNEIDRVLGELRGAVGLGDAAGVAEGRERVRAIVRTIAAGHEARVSTGADPEKVAADGATLERAGSDTFWSGFEADPLGGLDFLESNLAPLTADGRMFYLRAIGTDLDQFTRTFDRFYVVDGQAVPEGRRGLLLSKRTYERLLKNRVARELDALYDAWKVGARIAEDPLLQKRAARLPGQYARILFQVSPSDAAILEPKLRALLPGIEGGLAALLPAFLEIDDTTIEARHSFFYAEIAPLVRLYEIPVGKTVTLRAFTRAGYARSVTVPVWGTYEFRGLEKSDTTTASNLLDLITWRELYGKMSAEQQAELSDIRAQAGLREVDAATVEDALFGEGSGSHSGAVTVASSGFDEFAGLALGGRVGGASLTLDPAQQHRGLALNAAVLLHDPAQTNAVAAKIRALSVRDDLGIQVVDWQGATGILGQFIGAMRVALYAAIFVIFLVSLIIINNTMVAATVERVGEIGTMRAIGATRGFVVGMFVVETLVLGLASGTLGAGFAALFVAWLGRVGLPAPQDAIVILFGGPRLFPTTSWGNHAFGITTILVVSVLSTLYPAVLAARVSPVVAMQDKE
ncbi:MAG: FtsX-like permease family protein [Myxococcota bacterium]